MRTARLLMLAARAAATTFCGDVSRASRAPVILVIDALQAAQGNHPSTLGGTLFSDVQTIVTAPAPCSATSPCATVFNDVGQVEMHITPKDIGVPAFNISPSQNNSVTINRYHVVYRRSDGRNVPGVDVPFPFDGAFTMTVPAAGATGGFELVRHIAKEESPLVQLINGRIIITTIADITFYGHDLVGNEISVTGSMTIDFGNFGDS
jgi:hypothetical protein